MLGWKWQGFGSLHSLAINFLYHQHKATEQWEDNEGKQRCRKRKLAKLTTTRTAHRLCQIVRLCSYQWASVF